MLLGELAKKFPPKFVAPSQPEAKPATGMYMSCLGYMFLNESNFIKITTVLKMVSAICRIILDHLSLCVFVSQCLCVFSQLMTSED